MFGTSYKKIFSGIYDYYRLHKILSFLHQVFGSRIMSMADVGAGGEDVVVTFESIAILTPR